MFKKITDNIYFYEGVYRDSNTIMVKSLDDVLLIDLGTGNNINMLLNALSQFGIDFQKAHYYFTHSHCDHIGGYSFIYKRANDELVSYLHEAEFNLVNSGDYKHMYCPFYGIVFDGTKITNPVSDGDIIRVGNIELNVIHTPGHTIGSTVLYESKNRVLISGDTIFSNGSVGRWDFITGDKTMLNESLLKLSDLDIEIILSGHMSPALHNGNKIIDFALSRFFD